MCPLGVDCPGCVVHTEPSWVWDTSATPGKWTAVTHWGRDKMATIWITFLTCCWEYWTWYNCNKSRKNFCYKHHAHPGKVYFQSKLLFGFAGVCLDQHSTVRGGISHGTAEIKESLHVKLRTSHEGVLFSLWLRLRWRLGRPSQYQNVIIANTIATTTSSDFLRMDKSLSSTAPSSSSPPPPSLSTTVSDERTKQSIV